MKTKVFAIYDSKTDAYMTPFFAPNGEDATRRVLSTAQQPNSLFHQFADDYTVMELGEWDEDSGTITTLEQNRVVGNVRHLINQYNKAQRDLQVVPQVKENN